MRHRATLILIAALAAGGAEAQPFTFDLGEIVLSPSRTPLERARTGTSVTVLGGAALSAAAGGMAAEALARAPGVSFTAQGPFGNIGTLRIRGADFRYIATYFEGIRIDDPTGTNVSTNMGLVAGPGLGRAEILRGSQSAVWGGSAVGGVVTLAGPQVLREGLAQSFEAEGGGYGTLSAAYALTWKRAGTEIAFGLARFSTDGFSAASAGTEPDGASSLRATLTGRFAVSEAVTLGFAAFAQEVRQDFDGFDPVTFALVDQANRQTNRQAGARVFAEVRAGATRHTLEASAFLVERRFDFSGVPAQFDGARLSLAWRGETTVSPALALLWGAEVSEERATYANIPGGGATTGLAGAFVQALWAPTDRIDVSAAARFDHNASFGGFPTGRLAVAFRPDAATVIRAAVANGFRAPSIDERFGNYPGLFPFVGNPALEPERSVSAEIGVERTFAGGGRVAATAFLLDTDNLITYVFGAPATLVNRPGVATRRGVEVEAALPLGAQAGLDLAYTFTEATAASGARLALVPRHQVTAGLRADLTRRLSASLTLTHVADRAGQFGGTAPDYTVAGAALRYALTDRAEVWLRVENLGDATYEVTPGYGTARRTVHVGLSARF